MTFNDLLSRALQRAKERQPPTPEVVKSTYQLMRDAGAVIGTPEFKPYRSLVHNLERAKDIRLSCNPRLP